MPTRHLTDDQRRSFARYTHDPSPEHLARYFHLDRFDLGVIKDLRSAHNRLGFAVVLCTARFLGAFPNSADDIPASVLTTLKDQLHLAPDATLDGYFDGRTFERHVMRIRSQFGFTDFGDNPSARFRLCRWLYTLCWSGDDRPGPLIERAESWLVVNKILLPGITVLERFVGRIRERAQARLWRRLVTGLSPDQRDRIRKLFDTADTAAFSALDALRTIPTKRSPTEFFHHLDRLDAVRAFDLRPMPPRGVPAATLERLARVARISKPSAIAALQEPRRTATVAALFYTLEAAAQDDATELAEALLADLIRDAEGHKTKARLRSVRDLDEAALLLSEMGRLVISGDDLPLDRWREALFERLPRTDIEAAMAEVAAIAQPSGAKPYAELLAQWRRARRLFFNIATRIKTETAPGGKSLKATLDYLQSVPDWSKSKMRDAPVEAVPAAWKPYVLDEDTKVKDPKAYVFATIDAWRSAIKRRDVFVAPGIRYGDPRRGMLEGLAWQESKLLACRAIGRSLDAATEMEALSGLLDQTFRQVAARAEANPDLRFETVEERTQIVVSPLDRLEEPPTLKPLRQAIHAMTPKAALPDIFLEVMARTDFAKAFTHISERQSKVEALNVSLCAALVGQACNIGLEPLVRPDIPALRQDRLSWVSQNFIRPETLALANAAIVAAHSRLPIIKHWGTGEVASADGMRFTAPASAIHAGPNPKYFGQARGVTWYNMISDQFSGLNAMVVPGTLRDSLVVLALLLDQETELEPIEIMTDTAAYSDAIFGLFWLLGFRFSPRLADIGGVKLWRIDKSADYGAFNPITEGVINIRIILENWPDLIRLAGSLKLGHLKAAGVMRMLQIKDRPTSLAKALSQLGRIIKTLHILNYIDDPVFRRRILIQLNRQELRHKLGRRIHIGDRGEIRSPLRQGQEEQLGALGLALNAIVHWNAIYMQEALAQIQGRGVTIDPADISRLSPIFWRHINFLGRYEFHLPEDVAKGGLRPLREPNSEWDL